MGNRKQRRAAKKAGKPVEREPVINVKRTDLERLKAEATDLAMERAFLLMLAIPLLTLRDKKGYGKKRLEEFADDCLSKYDLFQKGNFSLEDFHQILYDECGMQIRNVEFVTDGRAASNIN